MAIQLFKSTCRNLPKSNFFSKRFAETACNPNFMKVTVTGASGAVAQSLSLMLKQSPLVDELCLFDMMKPIDGIALDLSYVDTKCKVTCFVGREKMSKALKNSKIIVIVSPQSQHFCHINIDTLFEKNAPSVKEIVTQMAHNAPKAFLAVTVDPVNSLIPMASEILKKKGRYNPNAIFGIVTQHIVRLNTTVAEIQGLEPECVTVPIVGGCSDNTRIPVLTEAKPCAEFTNEELEEITKTKSNASAIMTQAFAIARFIISLLKAIRGYQNIVEIAYVKINNVIHPQLKYMTTPIMLGQGGIVKNLGIPDSLSDYENCQLDNIIPVLTKDIQKGEQFVGVEDPPPCDPCDPNPKAPRCPPNHCELQMHK